ncbi:unnamed protein product [Leptidea sinapis]|uniref:Ig-like domain-containing protein n=1 Tax=Leptidea sinapis TaxID=189913 RepID=A0A5E4QPG2_9NEOP|nr:unnamed protein product [Leptidea sinapis]
MVWAAPLVQLMLLVLPSLAGPGPGFSSRQRTAVVARAGDSAALRCSVLRLHDRAVSWIRSNDLQILTHAGVVFTADSRVSCSDAAADHSEKMLDDDTAASQEWEGPVKVHTLRLERLRLSDSGRYECQINTEPKMSLFFNLTVIDTELPTVQVSAAVRDVRGALGGVAQLTCEARYVSWGELSSDTLAALPPLRVHWQHEEYALDTQSSRGGISLETERWPGRSVSRLTLAQLSASDAGRYMCAAHGASAHLHLHVDGADITEGAGGGVEWMQRDQAVARVSSAPRQRRHHALALSLTLALSYAGSLAVT